MPLRATPSLGRIIEARRRRGEVKDFAPFNIKNCSEHVLFKKTLRRRKSMVFCGKPRARPALPDGPSAQKFFAEE
ncbi:MAG: hypothetical protein A3C50_02415 [Candidatus Staskawiczbacteria bacterium RIFCSPHIGHO2_02_FULL_43_16]|nr:MAG: hypothetical protein A3C50_02415 [Candidatus Staskawiczbacteria bacterium RIFCSPHIGHO2_02_FULL_43_16]